MMGCHGRERRRMIHYQLVGIPKNSEGRCLMRLPNRPTRMDKKDFEFDRSRIGPQNAAKGDLQDVYLG